MAADLVIVEVDEIVPTGAIGPEEVEIPGALVDYVVVRGRK
jgi:acetate CoA/acetoacetate CoA-transferase alpha subunit